MEQDQKTIKHLKDDNCGLPQCLTWLLDRAAGLPTMPTAIINAGSELALASTQMAYKAGLIEPTLIGDPIAIKRAAKSLKWDITGLPVIPAHNEETAASIGIGEVHAGRAQLLMKGHLHTDILVRALLNRQTGLRTSERLSHLFHLSLPNVARSFCVADAVVNIKPDLPTQLSIMRSSTSVLHALGKPRPKVALLSATEVVTPAMPSSVQAQQLLELMTADDHAAANVYGPLAMDGAISPEAARIKGIDHSVAGHADLLLVPNIETGNAIFKLMVYFNGATAAGIITGAKVPVMLTSRADPPAARLASTALAVIYANHLQS